jgi:hypothetical protein
MMIDTRIYGYVADGGTYHPACIDWDPKERADVAALFSYHDDDPHGLTCDKCSEVIFEPMERHPFDAPKRYDPEAQVWVDTGDLDGQCYQCSEYLDDWLHEPETPDDQGPTSAIKPMDESTFLSLWGEG